MVRNSKKIKKLDFSISREDFYNTTVKLGKYMKKNPPINEQMIKAMMTQMGRTPSQKQVNQMMKSMTKYM